MGFVLVIPYYLYKQGIEAKKCIKTKHSQIWLKWVLALTKQENRLIVFLLYTMYIMLSKVHANEKMSRRTER